MYLISNSDPFPEDVLNVEFQASQGHSGTEHQNYDTIMRLGRMGYCRSSPDKVRATGALKPTKVLESIRM